MLSSFFQGKSYRFKQTFTYYVPAPPSRKTGYQEKEFDYITKYITELGFHIIDIKVESHSSENSCGMWVICVLGTNDQNLASKKIDLDFTDLAGSKGSEDLPIDPDIIHEI